MLISDECLENCLSAIAYASKDVKDTCLILSKYPHFMDILPGFMRHP